MCSRKTLQSKLEVVSNRFLLEPPGQHARLFEPGEVNAYDHGKYPIITCNDPSELTLDFRWGLIPPDWKREPKEIWNSTINAKLEHLETTYSWQKVIQNRCLIPVTSYFEYHWEDAKGSVKTKYEVRNSYSDIFALAGLFSTWTSPDGEVFRTYTVCTTAGNETMQFVHNKDAASNNFRMPVMLNREDERAWLNPAYNPMDFSWPNYKPGLFAFPAISS